MDTLVVTLRIGIYWLISGLILHLICRGLWVGLVGLSYAFPEGINLKKLKYQPKYMVKAEAVPRIEEIILKLERICSFIYSVSFLLFMSLVGTNIFVMVVIVVPIAIILSVFDALHSVDEGLSAVLKTYANWVLILGSFGVMDFLTMGYFRRYKIFAKIYWPFYVSFNFLTLSNFYRPTYFTIVTNLNK